MSSDSARLIKRLIIVAFFGITLMASAIATNPTTSAATNSGTQCPYTAKCPIDGAVSNYVSSEFSGITEIGIYEHSLVTGGVHRFRVRCN
jgi:hypothetical protein